MAHNLSKQAGKVEMFSAGNQPVWHGLGQRVNNTVKWREAIKYAHLDWTVSKHQLELDGVKIPAWGIVRDDNKKYLSTVGPEYTPIQNKEAFNFVDSLLDSDNDAHYETAGALNNGDTIWCLAKIGKDIKVGEDVSKNYLLFTDYRIQGKSAIAKVCSTRVVCNNTLNVALRENSTELKLRHNKNINVRMVEAKDILNSAHKEIDTLSEKLNFLAKKKVNKKTVAKVLKNFFPKIMESNVQQQKAYSIIENFECNDNDTFKEQRGTAYNLLNAFTNYVDHKSTVRVQDNGELVIEKEQLREQKRAENALFGKGDILKTNALDFILKTVEFSPSVSSVDSILSNISI